MYFQYQVCFLIFVLSLYTCLPINAQNPCVNTKSSKYILSPLPQNQFPPLSVYMPFDVLIGYVAFDTIYKSSTTNNFFVPFIKRQNFGDTLKKIARHYFAMKDYDPTLFKRTSLYRQSGNATSLGNIGIEIENKIEKTSPQNLLDYALLSSDYILHVKVNQVNTHIDTITNLTINNVRVTILEPIKGKIIPFGALCNQSVIKESNQLLTSYSSADSGSCLTFSYSPNWKRADGNQLYEQDGSDWIKIGNEYIVFLDIVSYCQDSNGFITCTIRPTGSQSGTFNLFPIKEGIVVDPLNDFGFGMGTTPSTFKQNLRNRISQINQW